MGFYPVAVVGKLVKNKKKKIGERELYTGATIYNTIQKHRIHKIEKHTIQEHKYKRVLKNLE